MWSRNTNRPLSDLPRHFCRGVFLEGRPHLFARYVDQRYLSLNGASGIVSDCRTGFRESRTYFERLASERPVLLSETTHLAFIKLGDAVFLVDRDKKIHAIMGLAAFDIYERPLADEIDREIRGDSAP